jgi:hypothetical protein
MGVVSGLADGIQIDGAIAGQRFWIEVARPIRSIAEHDVLTALEDTIENHLGEVMVMQYLAPRRRPAHDASKTPSTFSDPLQCAPAPARRTASRTARSTHDGRNGQRARRGTAFAGLDPQHLLLGKE